MLLRKLLRICVRQEVCSKSKNGWSGRAMVLSRLPVSGRPANLDYGMARANCTCIRCGWVLFGHFYSHLSFLFFLPLSGRRPDFD